MVGFASGVHYLHPDKPPQMFVNEVGVSPAHQGRGLGKSVLQALLEKARALGCTEAWVLTDRGNLSAMRLYGGAGGRDDGDSMMWTFPLGGA